MLNGTVFNIMRYSVHDGPGIRTTVFFKGCPLSCKWCHNPEGIHTEPQPVFYPGKCINCGNCDKICPAGAREIIGYSISPDDLLKEIKKDLIFYEQSGGGVTFSGGEPLYQSGFLLEMLKKCADEYIHTAIDTSGYCDTAVILKAAQTAKLILFDIKFFDEKKHIEYCGVSNKIMLENLKALDGTKASINIRVPVIPGINDDICEMRNICEYIKDFNISGVNLLPYHNIQSDKYNRMGMNYKMPDLQENNNINEIKSSFEKYFKTKIGG